MQLDWHEHFFSGLAVDFWLAVAPPPDDDVAFLRSIFGDGGGEILDVACGAGRHTIPLAHAGYRMTGVDVSPAFLAHARKTAGIDWQQRDMRDLPWPGRFDGALCFGNSFGYLGRQGSADAIAAVAAALKPGAAFVLESGAAAESLLPSLQPRRWMQVGDILYLSAATYDAIESRLDVEYTFLRGTERETKTASTSIFTVAELIGIFVRSGFLVEGAYASTRRDPFTLGAPRLLLVARKS